MTSRCECRDACGVRESAVGSMLQTSAFWAWGLPRGLENASHVLGRALWHALVLTDASPPAPQSCRTFREDKRTGFTVPPQTTRDLLGHPSETGRGNVKDEGRGREGNGGARGKGYSKPTRGAATSDDDDQYYCSFSEHLLCKGTGTTERAFENACLGDLCHVQRHLLHLG